MIDFKLYMRHAAYPRVRSEYFWERWLRIAKWFLAFPRVKRNEMKFIEEWEFAKRAAETQEAGQK